MRPRPPEPRVRTISLLEEGKMAVQTAIIDENKLNAFLGQLIGELGATVNAGLIVLGDRLGLYKAMAQSGPITSAELAEKTGTSERYVREWLNARASLRAASGSSAPATTRTSSAHGYPRWMGSTPSCAWARRSPTWVAGWVHRRGSWRRPTRGRSSPASTTTRSRSPSPARRQRTPGFRTPPDSKSHPRPSFQ